MPTRSPFHTVRAEEMLCAIRVLVALYVHPHYPKNCCSGAVSQMFPCCSLRSFLTALLLGGFQQDVPFFSGHGVPLLTHERAAAGNLPYGGDLSVAASALPQLPWKGTTPGVPVVVSVWFCKAGHSLLAARVSASLSQHRSSLCAEPTFCPPLPPVCMHVSDPAVLTMCCSG